MTSGDFCPLLHEVFDATQVELFFSRTRIYYEDAIASLQTDRVPDTNLLRGPHSGFVGGDCLGNLYLGQCIGDEEVLMGRCFG
jgi:hypothetical protein